MPVQYQWAAKMMKRRDCRNPLTIGNSGLSESENVWNYLVIKYINMIWALSMPVIPLVRLPSFMLSFLNKHLKILTKGSC